MRRLIVNVILMLVLPIVTLLASAALLTGTNPTETFDTLKRIPGAVITGEPGSVGDTPRLPPRNDRKVVALARSVCPKTLPAKTCRTLPIAVKKMSSGTAGQAHYVERVVTSGADQRSSLTATSMDLSTVLRTDTDEYVRHVAAHEWNHVRQYRWAKTPERLDALQDRANAYFQPRAKTNLSGTTAGLELLTDCQAVLLDKRGLGPHRGAVSSYVDQYLTSRTMPQACGSGWSKLMR